MHNDKAGFCLPPLLQAQRLVEGVEQLFQHAEHQPLVIVVPHGFVVAIGCRQACAKQEIKLNVAEIKRSEKEMKEDCVYLDEVLYKQCYVCHRKSKRLATWL